MRRGDHALGVRRREARRNAVAPLFRWLAVTGRTDIWLARQCGLSRNQISNIKAGIVKAPASFLDQASLILGVPFPLVSDEARAVVVRNKPTRQGQYRRVAKEA